MIEDLTASIGNTPLVALKHITEGCAAVLAAKLEGANPGGSIKDRPALYMIEQAEKDGLLAPGGVIIEPTSGNTGIGLALIGAAKGYEMIVTMPETMSIERRKILSSYGARVVLTSADGGMAGAIAEARRLASETRDAFIPMQFTNPANPLAHMETTGPEIWEATDGKVSGVVCGVGTGGTASGLGVMLKSMNPDISIIAVEPSESAVLTGGEPGPHVIEGIGPGFVPDVLDMSVIDEVIAVSGEEAGRMTKRLAAEEGIFAGISSGAATAAAMRVARREENRGKLFVVILPDRGEKYLSTGLWD
jgi:cysteine synthase A